VSARPLALVLGLTAGDYLVWNWSLSGNHDVPALVSGLTLPPLVAAAVLLLATTALRLLARSTRRVGVAEVSHSTVRDKTAQRPARGVVDPDPGVRASNEGEWGPPEADGAEGQRRARVATRRRPSRKLAA